MISVLIDWQVKVSRDIKVTEIKPMSVDPTRMRFMPIFLSTGELYTIVPADTESAAVEKAEKIAQYIAAAGVWGMEIDHAGFLATIEKLL